MRKGHGIHLRRGGNRASNLSSGWTIGGGKKNYGLGFRKQVGIAAVSAVWVRGHVSGRQITISLKKTKGEYRGERKDRFNVGKIGKGQTN